MAKFQEMILERNGGAKDEQKVEAAAMGALAPSFAELLDESIIIIGQSEASGFHRQ